MIGALILGRDGRPGEVECIFLFGDHCRQCDEIRNDGDDIDNVHDVPEEVELVGAREEAHGQLEREPYDTDGFDEEERVRDIRNLILLYLGAIRSGVEHLKSKKYNVHFVFVCSC